MNLGTLLGEMQMRAELGDKYVPSQLRIKADGDHRTHRQHEEVESLPVPQYRLGIAHAVRKVLERENRPLGVLELSYHTGFTPQQLRGTVAKMKDLLREGERGDYVYSLA